MSINEQCPINEQPNVRNRTPAPGRDLSAPFTINALHPVTCLAFHWSHKVQLAIVNTSW